MLPTSETFKLPLPHNTVLAFCSGLPSSCLPCDTILTWKVSGQLSPVGLSTDSECFILGTDWRFSGEGEGAGSVCYVLEGVKTLSLKAHWGPFIFPDAEWNFFGLGFWRGPWEWFVYGYGIDKEQRITSKPSVLSAKPSCGLHIQVPGRRSTSTNTVWVPHRSTRPGNKEPGGQGLNGTTAVISVVWPSLILRCGTRNQSITDTWAVCPECFVFQSLGCPLQVLY